MYIAIASSFIDCNFFPYTLIYQLNLIDQKWVHAGKFSTNSGQKALKDAGIDYKQVQQACCSYVYGDTTSGQRIMYCLGMTGIPVYNVSP